MIVLTLTFIRQYQEHPTIDEDVVVNTQRSKLLFGFAADSFHIEESTVTRNQSLSDILIDRGVSISDVDQIAKNSITVFDVRKLRSGNRYTVFYSKDSTRNPIYLAYENNSVEYYVYSLTDSLKVISGKHEVISKRQIISEIGRAHV